MNIREVEQLTGLKKANIRYYEQEGLLSPQRNEQNNYREYSAGDVEILEKIKILRTLGVSIHDIGELQKGKTTVPAIMEKRTEELDNELNQARELRELCVRAEKTASTFESIDPLLINSNSLFFHKKGENVMKLDKIHNAEKKAEKLRELLCLAAGLGAFLLSILRHTEEEEPLWFTVILIAVVAALIICFFVLWYRSYRR
jgi:DNA-binding transcriptional MerR regulator